MPSPHYTSSIWGYPLLPPTCLLCRYSSLRTFETSIWGHFIAQPLASGGLWYNTAVDTGGPQPSNSGPPPTFPNDLGPQVRTMGRKLTYLVDYC
ncbi:hypothetical protein RSAG8_12907, partial [Rhizoctonia solani AG-8 WAC10335]